MKQKQYHVWGSGKDFEKYTKGKNQKRVNIPCAVGYIAHPIANWGGEDFTLRKGRGVGHGGSR